MALPAALEDIDPLGVRASDDLFDAEELGALVRTVAAIPLYFLNHSDYQATHPLYGHWEYPIVDVSQTPPRDIADEIEALDDTLEPIKAAWRRMRTLLPPHATTVNCYVNGYTYGTDGFPHVETTQRPRDQYNLLVYCCPRWEPAWGGETVFFDADGDISAAVLPKPGRTLLFRGDVLHVARAPSRFCPMERRVLVVKARTGELATARG